MHQINGRGIAHGCSVNVGNRQRKAGALQECAEVTYVDEWSDADYGAYQRFDYTIGTCLQEIGENGFDHAHFQFVHSHPRVGNTEKVTFDGYDRTVLSSRWKRVPAGQRP